MLCQPQKIEYKYKNGGPLWAYVKGSRFKPGALNYIYRFYPTLKRRREQVNENYKQMVKQGTL